MTNRLLLVKHTALCDGNFLPVVFFQAFAFHHPSQKEISIQAGVGVLRYDFLCEASRAPFGMQTPDGRNVYHCHPVNMQRIFDGVINSRRCLV